MKTIFHFLCVAFMVTAVSLKAVGQGNSDKKNEQGKKEEKVKERGKSEEHMKSDEKGKGKPSQDSLGRLDDDPNKGKAYGKDKDGMSGIEFGKMRSKDAKAKMKGEVQRSGEYAGQVEERIVAIEAKIKKAKENLEKNKKAGKIKPDAAKMKEEKLKSLEAKLVDLKGKSGSLREKSKKQKEALDS